MDTEAAEVARRQDESEAARKQLIEQSREFKKSASEVWWDDDHNSFSIRNIFKLV